MPTIEIEVKNKIAKSPEKRIVCGNSDFEIKFAFDEEWAEHNVKTARFAYNGTHEDIVFNGNVCKVPIIRNTNVCMVGVFAGDLRTTTPAIVSCDKSILCANGAPADPQPDVYHQLMEQINAGMIKGDKGDKGEKGDKGDKGKSICEETELTEEEKAQARANIGAMSADAQLSLSTRQINAMASLFRLANYTKDASAEYDEFSEAFGVVEPVKLAYIIHRSYYQLNDSTMSISQNEVLTRLMAYSAIPNDKRLVSHNGSYWDNSNFSPLEIPTGAAFVKVDIPNDMKYLTYIAKQHTIRAERVQVIASGDWCTTETAMDVSEYGDGKHYLGVIFGYQSDAEIPVDFDTSVLNIYFTDANGNRIA